MQGFHELSTSFWRLGALAGLVGLMAACAQHQPAQDYTWDDQASSGTEQVAPLTHGFASEQRLRLSEDQSRRCAGNTPSWCFGFSSPESATAQH